MPAARPCTKALTVCRVVDQRDTPVPKLPYADIRSRPPRLPPGCHPHARGGRSGSFSNCRSSRSFCECPHRRLRSLNGHYGAPARSLPAPGRTVAQALSTAPGSDRQSVRRTVTSFISSQAPPLVARSRLLRPVFRTLSTLILNNPIPLERWRHPEAAYLSSICVHRRPWQHCKASRNILAALRRDPPPRAQCNRSGHARPSARNADRRQVPSSR